MDRELPFISELVRFYATATIALSALTPFTSFPADPIITGPQRICHCAQHRWGGTAELSH